MVQEIPEINDDRLVVELPSELKEAIRDYADKNRVTMSLAVRVMLYKAMTLDLLKKQVTSKDRKVS